MLSGDNSILQKATDAKQISERAEAKEQAQMDIMAYIADKTANHQDASLDDSKIQEILSDNKSYVKTANATSFITTKGEYEIPYSELYEVVNGVYHITYKPAKKKPIEEFLKPQKRFKHMFKPGNEWMIEEFQKEVDRRWEELLHLEEITNKE